MSDCVRYPRKGTLEATLRCAVESHLNAHTFSLKAHWAGCSQPGRCDPCCRHLAGSHWRKFADRQCKSIELRACLGRLPMRAKRSANANRADGEFGPRRSRAEETVARAGMTVDMGRTNSGCSEWVITTMTSRTTNPGSAD